MNKKVLSVILGGGVGSRLYPLTATRSKPAVPIAGKYRLIDIPISNCINSGLKRIFVLTQFNSASLNRHLKIAYRFDHFSNAFVDILAAEQTRENQNWFQGTADAVRQIIPHLDVYPYEYILVLSGDHLYQMDYTRMIQHHIDSGADITVGTIPVVREDCSGFGIIKVDAEGEIKSFIEKPKEDVLDDWTSPVSHDLKEQGKEYLASMGIYVFSRGVMKRLLQENADTTDFGKEIIPIAVNGSEKVASYPYTGYWTDIGSIPSFFEANLRLTQYLPEFNLYNGDQPVYTRSRMLAPAKFYGTRLYSTLVSGGCVIHAESIEHSVIGIRSRIGEETVIRNAICMGINNYQHQTIDHPEYNPHPGIGKNCHLENVIVDTNARISDNVWIKGSSELEDTETESYCIRDGIVIVKKGAHVPEGTRIG